MRFMKKEIEREIKENDFLFKKIDDEFIREREYVNFKWFVGKAIKNKYYYYILTSITIIYPVISEIMIFVPTTEVKVKLITGAILGTSTIAAAMLSMLDVRRKWGIYRNQAENIKNMLTQYGIETNKTKKDEIVKQLEESYSDTHEEWMTPFQKGNTSKKE